MLSGLSVGGASAVSFSVRVNKLRSLCSRRHSSLWPVTLPQTNWPPAKGHTSPLLLLRPSPAPSHPVFVHASPSPLPSSSDAYPCLSSVALSASSLPSFLVFISCLLLLSSFAVPSSACQSCLQPCIISWTELLWVWSRSGSDSPWLITENTTCLSSCLLLLLLRSLALLSGSVWGERVDSNGEKTRPSVSGIVYSGFCPVYKHISNSQGGLCQN